MPLRINCYNATKTSKICLRFHFRHRQQSKSTRNNNLDWDVQDIHHHHHHRDAKRLAGAYPAVAIVRQNGRCSASCRASVAVTPVSRQIWWVQVVDGRPQARLHSCEDRSPSLNLMQICRIWFAGTSRRSLATCPKRPSLRLRTMYETSNRRGTMQDFIVRYEVVPSDVQDAHQMAHQDTRH